MLIQASAILWRKCNNSTFKTLNDLFTGQYHIVLTKKNFELFFVGVPPVAKPDDGYSLEVPLQPFTGPDSVPLTTLTLNCVGTPAKRGDWHIPQQRSTTAYPLWRPNRGAPKAFSETANEFLLIVRDVNNNFHARWIRDTYFGALPPTIKTMLKSNEAGWGPV